MRDSDPQKCSYLRRCLTPGSPNHSHPHLGVDPGGPFLYPGPHCQYAQMCWRSRGKARSLHPEGRSHHSRETAPATRGEQPSPGMREYNHQTLAHPGCDCQSYMFVCMEIFTQFAIAVVNELWHHFPRPHHILLCIGTASRFCLLLVHTPTY